MSVLFIDIPARRVEHAQVVFIAAHFFRLREGRPDKAVYLVLLYVNLVCFGFCQEKNHALFNFSEWAVIADLPVMVIDFYIKPRFFLDFTQGRLFFRLSLFYMPLREAPVFAVMVFDEQDLVSIGRAVKNNRAAGFFVKARKLEISSPRTLRRRSRICGS